MEILLFKIKEELLLLENLKKKTNSLGQISTCDLNNVFNDWMFTLAFFNKRNDFSPFPRIDVKNKNYDSFIGNLMNLMTLNRNCNELVDYIESTLEYHRKKFDQKIQKFFKDETVLKFKDESSDLILFFEEKKIEFHKNFIVQHFLEENVPLNTIVYNFSISNLFMDSSNLTLSKQIQYNLYDQYDVRYQGFGNPFLSWFSLMDDCYCSSAFDLDIPNGLPNFLELNLNCYNKGNWVVMMPTTIKEFKKVFNKIESFLHNERKTFFILIYPDWEHLQINSIYLKEKKTTTNLTFQSNRSGELITKKIAFNVCMVCYKQTKKLVLF